jgi:TruD family tRNA pseudouridine synthase
MDDDGNLLQAPNIVLRDTRRSRVVRVPRLPESIISSVMSGDQVPAFRHYSTIGIGDVFADETPRVLPNTYLDHLPEIRSSNGNFLSDECVGVIKSSADDFVVREIGLKGRHISGLSEEQVEAVRVAHLVSPTDIPIVQDGAPESSQQDPVNPTATPGDQAKATKKDAAASDSPDDTPPLEVIRKMLAQAVGISTTEKEKAQSNVDTVLQELRNLELQALNRIEAISREPSLPQHQANDAVPETLTPQGTVWIPALSSTGDDTSQDRGAFHRALRLAFPTLRADAATVDPQSTLVSSPSKGREFQVVIDDRFFGLIPYLFEPRTDLPSLYLFYKRGFVPSRGRNRSLNDHRKRCDTKHGMKQHSSTRRDDSQQDTTDCVLRFRPDLPRNERRPIHQIIEAKTNGMLGSDTVSGFPLQKSLSETTAAAVMRWTEKAERAIKKRKRPAGVHEEDPSTHILCVVKKKQKEHLGAVHLLVNATGCRQADVGVAGIKDKQAVTYQFFTLSNTPVERLLRANDILQSNGMELGTIHKVGWRLKIGDLEGNRFNIVLRCVRRVQVELRGDQTIKENFIVGDSSYVQSMVSRLRKSGFVNFFGEQRVGAAGDESEVGVRSFDIGRAMLQQDFAKAVDLLMTGRLMCRDSEKESPEVRKVRLTWKESGGDPFETWKNLPHGDHMSRERLVLKGLKRYGKDDPLAAIRCLHRNERVFWINAFQSYVWNSMATERLKLYGAKVVEGDLILRKGHEDEVEFATGDLSGMSIYDVVLPLPGSDVLYPCNLMAKLYEDILDRSNVRFEKSAPPEATAKGGYRRVLVKANNLDCETFQEETKLSARLSFDLPKGSYATMLLRELLLTTVSRDSLL